MGTNNKTLNVPNLRFPEFKDEWNKINYSEIFKDFQYGMNAASTEYDGQNKYIRITDIDEETSLFNNKNVTSPNDELHDKYLVKENDILFARTGASTGKTYIYDKTDGKLYFAGFLIRGNVKETFNSNFIFHTTKTEKYNKWVKLMSARSGQPGINSKEYSSYTTLLPSREEQNKIGLLLSLIDNKIQTQMKIIEEYITLNKIFLNKLYPAKNCNYPEYRFKGFSDYWRQYYLRDILTEFSNKSIIENEYKVLSSTNRGVEYRDGRVSGLSNKGYKIIDINDLVLSPQNLWLGNININYLEKGLVSPSYKTFHFNNISSAFIAPILRTKRMMDIYSESSIQGASVVRKSLDLNLLLSKKILIPNTSEQEKISSFLNDFNSLITTLFKQYDKYNKLKSYLLENLLV